MDTSNAIISPLTGSNRLELKSIRDLSGMDFTIMDYQRGYRWTDVEVKQLLDDFAEFVKCPDAERKSGDFYCLQPVVVRRLEDDNKFEVIDGQQRLTTLNLILQYLSNGIGFLYPSFKLYDVKYVTRPDSREFLAKIKNPSVAAESYIDFYFMSKAYATIKAWFENIDDTLRNNILMALLETKKEQKDDVVVDNARNIRVIWYEVAADEKTSSVEIFTRLNIGKIPLTDAELVKALFLSNGHYNDSDADLRKINLSTEWNMIEQSLQDDAFWYFLNRSNNPLKYSGRIEFVFDIISERTLKSGKYFTFIKFQELISEEGAEQIWLKVKQIYNLLKEWFADRELYHIIGYLLEQGTKITDLISEWQSSDKTRFRKEYLRKKVGESLKSSGGDNEIADLTYNDKAKVKRVLLLFNILTVLTKDNSDMRFPFDRFKIEKWDIEHVCSQTDRTLEKSGIIPWCDDILEFYGISPQASDLSEDELHEDLDCESMMKRDIESGDFDPAIKKNLLDVLELRSDPDKDKATELFLKFQKLFKEGEHSGIDRDNIANLTLLDSATNRSYGNSFFPIKRKRIIENDSIGVFVPIATKNLFLKYFTPRVDNSFSWTREDGEKYRSAIVKTIKEYLHSNTDEQG